MDLVQTESVGSRGSLRSWVRLLIGGAAAGLIAGFFVAGKAIDPAHAQELAANKQWFAFAHYFSPPLRVWAFRGLLLGLAVAVSLAITGRFTLGFGRAQKTSWRLLVLALVGVPLLTVGLSLAPHLRPKPGGPNILLIVLDTTRPDRLSLYGYDRPTTPNLQALAAESAVFTEAYSNSSWTPPAHASLFTGMYPCDHGVTQEQAYIPELPSRFLTLAEALWESGYRTTGITGNGMLSRTIGWSQGFDEYHATWVLDDEQGTHPAESLLEAVLERDSDRPFFTFINLIEPHQPYDSSREFYRSYDSHPELQLDSYDWVTHLTGERPLSATDLQHLSDLYDSEIQYVDHLVGRLVGLLRERNALDETLVVITSDHGEHFGEHGLLDHRFNVYETNVRAVLVIRYPELFAPGSTSRAHVQLHDLFDFILAVGGKSGASRQYATEMLSVEGALEKSAFFEYYYPQREITVITDALARPGYRPAIDELTTLVPAMKPFMRRLRGVRSGDFKLILGSDGKAELYNIAEDPGELEDLSEREEFASELHALQARLGEQFGECLEQQAAAPSTIDLDDETIKQLKSLGYIR